MWRSIEIDQTGTIRLRAIWSGQVIVPPPMAPHQLRARAAQFESSIRGRKRRDRVSFGLVAALSALGLLLDNTLVRVGAGIDDVVGATVRTGGAPAFLRVVKEELIPEIERRYRSNGDRTLIGYSLGGLFAVHAMFQSPETFQRLILVSPSLWWDGNVAFRQEEAYAATHKALPVRIFMSVGEQETGSMLEVVRRLETALTQRRYQGLELTTRIFEGERHLSTFPVAVMRGLRTVFAGASIR